MLLSEDLEHERTIQAFARAMRAEGKGAFDQMGVRGHTIVWWELDAVPKLRTFGAFLWKERMFALAVVGLVLTALKLFWG
jgi:hypothetical protein